MFHITLNSILTPLPLPSDLLTVLLFTHNYGMYHMNVPLVWRLKKELQKLCNYITFMHFVIIRNLVTKIFAFLWCVAAALKALQVDQVRLEERPNKFDRK